ncbi:MAG: Ig domain-containing protein [Verrucomicrobiaceae bacterium]
MNRFRCWSRHAYILHGYLIATLILLPVPLTRVVAEDPPPDPPPPEEVWSFDHSESLVNASLQSSGQVHAGEQMTLQLYAETVTWEVWTSSYGNMRTENYVTSPASSAWLSWSQVSGDGYLTGSSSWTDGAGFGSAGFVMGNSQAVVRVDVSTGSSDVASATLTLDPLVETETWSWGYSGSTVTSVQWLPVEGGTTELTDGQQRTLTVEVTQDTWDQWNGSWGNTQTNTISTGVAAVNVPVTFYIVSGNGSFSASSSFTTSTDWQGRASATLTMGAGDTVVGVVAGDAGQTQVWGTNLGFTAAATNPGNGGGPETETWSFSGIDSGTAVVLESEGGITELQSGETHNFTATVTTWSREVWVSNWGNTAYAGETSAPASGATVRLSIEGDSGVSICSTDGNGQCMTAYQMGESAIRLLADVLDGSQTVVLATTTLEVGLAQEQWWYTGTDEATIGLNLAADRELTEVPEGTACTVTATVTFTSWEVWESSLGNRELRNYQEGVAMGAGVWFGMDSGDGSLDNGYLMTNEAGQATVTFTMGQQAARLHADAWFNAAYSGAALDFTPAVVEPVWVYDHSDGMLDVEMLHAAGSGLVTARVSYATWDVYHLSSDPTQTQTRNPASSPAIGAQVSFSFSSGSGTLGSSLAYGNANGDASTTYSTAAAAEVTAYVSFATLAQNASVAVEAYAPPLSITTDTLPHGTVGIDYTASITAAGGSAPYSFSVLSVQTETGLPFGYQLQGGTLTGTGDNSTGSQTAGTYTFSVEVTDNAGSTAQKQFTLVLDPVAVPPLEFVTTVLPQAALGTPYQARIFASGMGTLTFSASNLPDGLTLSPQGVLEGTLGALAGQTATISVTVQDEYFDPAMALYRRASRDFVLDTRDYVVLEIVKAGGDRQNVLPGQMLPVPLTVRIELDGVPQAGVPVAFGPLLAVTDAAGLAVVNWLSPPQAGGFKIPVTAGGSSTEFQAWAVTPPAPPVSGADPIAGASPPAATTHAVADAEVVVESRYVKEVGGEVSATFSEHVYQLAEEGQGMMMVHEFGGAPPWGNSKKNWDTSDGTSGTEPPDNAPAVTDLEEWVLGATEGFHFLGPDTSYGRISGIDDPFGSGIPQQFLENGQLKDGYVYDGGWFGMASGFYKRVTAEVRIRRATPLAQQSADPPPQVVKRQFVLVTYETDAQGVETVKTVESKTLEIPDDEDESALTITLSPQATGPNTSQRQRLLPVEFEVTEWVPVVKDGADVIFSLDANNPSQPALLDQVFVSGAPSGTPDEIFSVKTKVKFKIPGAPADVADNEAKNWEVKMLQNIVEMPTADTMEYLLGVRTQKLPQGVSLPVMDGATFASKAFTSAGEVVTITESGSSYAHTDTPFSFAFLYFSNFPAGNHPGIGASLDLLLNARRDATFVTWVYAEHKQTKAKQFLKWVRWKVNWDVDFSHGNTHPPGVTKKKYQFIKIDEGDGVGPVQTPSFNKATWEWKWTPKNTL